MSSIPISTAHDLFDGQSVDHSAQPPECPGLLASLGKYRVVRGLGTGGMGVVLLARDPDHPDALVAVKVLRPELTGNQRAVLRFLAEARHMQQFDHPHILRVTEVGVCAQRPYLVMPFVAGGNLAARLRRKDRPTEAEILQLAVQLADALAYAHTKGIIHRDLKPANVLLDAQGQALLTDFGLARSLFNDSIGDIHREHREGTAPYMSPAVARGEAEDTRCDIYSLGALLYEMLTLRPPYFGDSSAEVTELIQKSSPPPILELNPKASAALSRIAENCMARELRLRYAHMADVVKDLRHVEAGRKPEGPHGVSVRVNLAPLPKTPAHGLGRVRFRRVAAALLAGLGALWLVSRIQHAQSLSPDLAAVGGPRRIEGPAAEGNRDFLYFADGLALHVFERDPSRPAHLRRRGTFVVPTRPSLTNAMASLDDVRVERLANLDGKQGLELLVRSHRSGDASSQLTCFDFESGHVRCECRVSGRAPSEALNPLSREDLREVVGVLARPRASAP